MFSTAVQSGGRSSRAHNYRLPKVEVQVKELIWNTGVPLHLETNLLGDLQQWPGRSCEAHVHLVGCSIHGSDLACNRSKSIGVCIIFEQLQLHPDTKRCRGSKCKNGAVLSVIAGKAECARLRKGQTGDRGFRVAT